MITPISYVLGPFSLPLEDWYKHLFLELVWNTMPLSDLRKRVQSVANEFVVCIILCSTLLHACKNVHSPPAYSVPSAGGRRHSFAFG